MKRVSWNLKLFFGTWIISTVRYMTKHRLKFLPHLKDVAMAKVFTLNNFITIYNSIKYFVRIENSVRITVSEHDGNGVWFSILTTA